MKVQVVVTDDEGNVFKGDTVLVAVPGSRTKRESGGKVQEPTRREALDFSLPVRAFVKRYAKGLRGPQKFTLLLARLTGGKADTALSGQDVARAWNLGIFASNISFNIEIEPYFKLSQSKAMRRLKNPGVQEAPAARRGADKLLKARG